MTATRAAMQLFCLVRKPARLLVDRIICLNFIRIQEDQALTSLRKVLKFSMRINII